MAVNLVIEDGSGVSNANSYGVTGNAETLAAARQYAENRGVTLPSDNDALSVMLINGTDYIETFSQFFVGRQYSITQALSWPRSYVRNSDNSYFPYNQLPDALLQALYQLCIEQQNGIDLLASYDPETSGGFVVMEKVDVIETRYSEKIATVREPSMPKVDALLAKISSIGYGVLNVIRA